MCIVLTAVGFQILSSGAKLLYMFSPCLCGFPSTPQKHTRRWLTDWEGENWLKSFPPACVCAWYPMMIWHAIQVAPLTGKHVPAKGEKQTSWLLWPCVFLFNIYCIYKTLHLFMYCTWCTGWLVYIAHWENDYIQYEWCEFYYWYTV